MPKVNNLFSLFLMAVVVALGLAVGRNLSARTGVAG